MESECRESPIPDVRHHRFKDAEREYKEWGLTLTRMRVDEVYNKMVGYNRKDVIARRKELLKQMGVLKTAGLGNEVVVKRSGSFEGVAEFSQEDVYVSGSVRRHIYRKTGDGW